ncbi:MAG: DsrE family protein, partial [Promethearchaeota archaeon]
MVNSVVIICEDGPFGKDSVVESIRMAAGLLAVGDIEECKVILLRDAIHFLNKNLKPEILKMDDFENIKRLMELSELEILVHDEALEIAGMKSSDLILKDNVKIVDTRKISQLISEANVS